jgi:adenylate kinase family enzyme
MVQPLPLEALGRRIVVMGPSNAGKSTLAEALGRKLVIQPVFLDQLHHLPNTNWQPRSADEFHLLQREAISRPEWIMDGNYSALLPERLARATGAIVLDQGRWPRLGRYFRRTLLEKRRAGNLAGNKDSVKWSTIHWVLIGSRRNGARYRQAVQQSGLPHVFCHSRADLEQLYKDWGLSRTPAT